MRTNGHGKPIVSLDIDGTLGDYHSHFLAFAEGWFGRKFPDPKEINPGLPLWKFMKVPLEDYRQCKLAYRQGGLKRTMPAYGGIRLLTSYLRKSLGAEVWICTTRPYLRLDNIDPDTREWLARNGVEYDAVLFDRIDEKGSKYSELKDQAGDRVCSIVDDLPEMLDAARDEWPMDLWPRLYLRDQPYNRHREEFVRVYDMTDVLRRVADDVRIWKKEKGKKDSDG